jgi:uncharacterized protein YdeI (YjbR/CyaY-like superfamily)
MSSKVVEANAKIHSLAMAVAVSRVLNSSPVALCTGRISRVLLFFHEINLMTDEYGYF